MSWLLDRYVMISKLPDVDIEVRRSGRTTALLFKCISKAMISPEVPIVLEDHYFHNNDKKRLLYMIPDLKNILIRLELEGFYINKKEGTLTFSLDPLYDRRLKGNMYGTEI